jgi:hypothetical protein
MNSSFADLSWNQFLFGEILSPHNLDLRAISRQFGLTDVEKKQAAVIGEMCAYSDTEIGRRPQSD